VGEGGRVTEKKHDKRKGRGKKTYSGYSGRAKRQGLGKFCNSWRRGDFCRNIKKSRRRKNMFGEKEKTRNRTELNNPS